LTKKVNAYQDLLIGEITSKKCKQMGYIDQHQALRWSIYCRKNECVCKEAGDTSVNTDK